MYQEVLKHKIFKFLPTDSRIKNFRNPRNEITVTSCLNHLTSFVYCNEKENLLVLGFLSIRLEYNLDALLLNAIRINVSV